MSIISQIAGATQTKLNAVLADRDAKLGAKADAFEQEAKAMMFALSQADATREGDEVARAGAQVEALRTAVGDAEQAIADLRDNGLPGLDSLQELIDEIARVNRSTDAEDGFESVTEAINAFVAAADAALVALQGEIGVASDVEAAFEAYSL